MPNRSGPVLLTAFAAGALGVVEAVAWVGRTQDAWLVVVAVALMLALLLRLSLQLAGILDSRARRRAGVFLGGATAVALVAAALPFAGPAAAQAGIGAPQATVRGFLEAAVVDGDGVSACRYLSVSARAEFEQSSGQDCTSFFGNSAFRMGGRAIESHAQLADAHYAVTTDGRDRVVTMSYAGQRIRFVLAPASENERQEYLAPPTPWRIASDVTSMT